MTAHGPGPTDVLRPGRRASIMVVSGAHGAAAGMEEALEWVRAFEDDCGMSLDAKATICFAVATPNGLQDNRQPPTSESPSKFVDFILADGTWHHRGTVPAAPAEAGGVSDWAWMYYHTLRDAHPESLCTIWGVLPTAGDDQD